MSIVLSSLKLATIAQLTVLSTGFVGALCAYYGIFEVAVLKKMSKVSVACKPSLCVARGQIHEPLMNSLRLDVCPQLLTKVLLPALALSFFSKYSIEVLSEYGIVFAVATAHVLLGILMGHVAAFICRVQSPFAQVMALTCGMPHPALPLVMMPAIMINWSVAAADPLAEGKGLATIGIYLTIILLIFATVVNIDISTMAPKSAKPKVLAKKPPMHIRICRALMSIDHTLYCCAGALIIGIIAPLKDIFMPGGPMSWLAGTIKATGGLAPALSVYIIGGLIFNTRMAKLGAQKDGTKAAASSKKASKKGEPDVPAAVADLPAGATERTPSTMEAGDNAAAAADGVAVSLSAEQVAEYREAFSMFDADGGGDVDVKELGTHLDSKSRSIAVCAW